MIMGRERSRFVYTMVGYMLIGAILILLALGIGAVMYWAVVARHMSADSFGRWGGLAIFTVLTFWYVLKKCKAHWKKRAFWAVASGLLVLHLMCYGLLLSSVEHWNDVWFLVISTVEGPIAVSLTNMVMAGLGRIHRSV
jgi:hypothetical protein